jgi:hypothetical protein
MSYFYEHILRLYVLISHIHHIIILLVYNFLAIMNKTTKIKKDTGKWIEDDWVKSVGIVQRRTIKTGSRIIVH